MSRGHQGHTLSAANEDAVAASEKFRCIHQRLFVHPVTSRKADCICSLLCRCARAASLKPARSKSRH